MLPLKPEARPTEFRAGNVWVRLRGDEKLKIIDFQIGDEITSLYPADQVQFDEQWRRLMFALWGESGYTTFGQSFPDIEYGG